jgi:histidine phosphotransferase ChpT
MSHPIELRVLELLAARLCHDLISPVSAIANGVELLSDEDDGFAADALALVAESSRKAGRRLQFFRFAFGFSGGGLGGPPPHALAGEFFADTAIALEYGAAVRSLPLDTQKLACAMLACAGEALPRGGRLALALGDAGPQIDGAGEGGGFTPEAAAALALAAPVTALTTRTVGAYFAALLAEARGCRLALAARPEGFRLSAAATAGL